MRKRSWLLLILFILLVVFNFERGAGKTAQMFIEPTLGRIFGMKFSVDSLKFNPFTGHVRAKGVQFNNPPGFSFSPHLWIGELDAVLDVRALWHRHVNIRDVNLSKPYFLIERKKFGDTKKTNISTWVRHMKDRRRAQKEAAKSTDWQVTIDPIKISKGTFVYDDLTSDNIENRFVFQELDGSLDGFHWPSDAPTNLDHTVQLQGLMGSIDPAPIVIGGHANFATGQVSFDLTGHVLNGSMAEYKRFWKEFPISVNNGRFDLDIRMICVRKKVRSQTALKLYDLKVTPSVRGGDIIWGVPVAAALGFLQNQKTIHLRVPVSGDITDPNFEFYRAFSEAFQVALQKRTSDSLKLVTQGPVILAEKTGKVVLKTQEGITGGIEKIASAVTKKEKTA